MEQDVGGRARWWWRIWYRRKLTFSSSKRGKVADLEGLRIGSTGLAWAGTKDQPPVVVYNQETDTTGTFSARRSSKIRRSRLGGGSKCVPDGLELFNTSTFNTGAYYVPVTGSLSDALSGCNRQLNISFAMSSCDELSVSQITPHSRRVSLSAFLTPIANTAGIRRLRSDLVHHQERNLAPSQWR